MQAEPVVVAGLIEVCRATIAANSEHLCELDRAIGDGDHGTNMKRGCDAVSAEGEALTALPFPEAVEKIGLTLVMNVGGAAGPLYGTLLMEIGRELRRLERLQDEGDADFRAGLRNVPGRSGDFPIVLKEAIDAVARRGRANAGDKTLLDVLYPVQAALSEQQTLGDIARRAERFRQPDGPHAGEARPSVLSRRPFDRPRRSRRVQLRPADEGNLQLFRGVSSGMNAKTANVGIVVVSHSPLVARGIVDMVRQMVGDCVPLSWSGGNVHGELGTDARGILKAIEAAWSDAGVAVFVDLGGAETNSEMAIEMLGAPRSKLVAICNAPLVEGAVIAAAEASGGASLAKVVATAEELSP